jgi:hypothetical protein
MCNPRILTSIDLLNSVMVFKGARIVELECGDGSSLMKVANALSIRDVYCVNIDEMP